MSVFVFCLSVLVGVGHALDASVKERSDLQSRREVGAKRETSIPNELASLLLRLHPVRIRAPSGNSRLHGHIPMMKQTTPPPSPAQSIWDKMTGKKPEPAPPPPPPPPEYSGLEKLMGKILVAFEKTGQAASDTADKWVNSEFAVDKESGTFTPKVVKEDDGIPESQKKGPSVVKIQQKVEEAAAGLGENDSSLARAVELRSEFRSILQPTEETSYSITSEGKIVFDTPEDLAALVAAFTYRKLLELAREPGRLRQALTSYIDDLEGDLGSANEAIAELRREVSQTALQLSESTVTSEATQAQLQDLQSILDDAQKELEAKSAAEEELLKVKAQQEGMQEELSKTRSELERLEAETAAAEAAAVARSEQEVAAANEEIAKLKLALDQQVEAERKAKEDVAKVQALLKEQEATAEDAEAELDLIQAEAAAEVAAAQAQAKSAVEEELLKVQVQQEEAQEELSKTKSELERLQAEMAAAEAAEAARSEQEVVAANEEIAKLKLALDQQVEAEIESKEEVTKVQELLQKQEAVAKEAEASLEQAQADAAAEVAAAQAQAKSAVEEELLKVQAQQEGAQEELSKTKSELERLQEEMAAAEAAEAERSEQETAAANEEIAKLKLALDQQVQAEREAKQEVAKVQTLLKEQEAVAKEVEAELGSLQAEAAVEQKQRNDEVVAAQAQVAALKQEVERLQLAASEKEEYAKKAASAELEVSELKSALDELTHAEDEKRGNILEANSESVVLTESEDVLEQYDGSDEVDEAASEDGKGLSAFLNSLPAKSSIPARGSREGRQGKGKHDDDQATRAVVQREMSKTEADDEHEAADKDDGDAELTTSADDAGEGTSEVDMERGSGIEETKTKMVSESISKDRPPISRMKKADLIAEFEEYGIDISGTVPDLRKRLRVERSNRA